jgi:hypothetical protein
MAQDALSSAWLLRNRHHATESEMAHLQRKRRITECAINMRDTVSKGK